MFLYSTQSPLLSRAGLTLKLHFTHLKFLENDQKFFLLPDPRPHIPLFNVILMELFCNVSKWADTTGLIPTVQEKERKKNSFIGSTLAMTKKKKKIILK